MSLDAMPKNPRRGVGELVSFKEEARAKQMETDRLENANRRLQEEVSSLRARLDTTERSSRQSSAAAAKDIADNENTNSGRIRSLETDLAEAKDEANKRVSETTQFQQMRKMMQSQANTIK
jgi:predicted  nucleic acid-binding Zn-ribbon protein